MVGAGEEGEVKYVIRFDDWYENLQNEAILLEKPSQKIAFLYQKNNIGRGSLSDEKNIDRFYFIDNIDNSIVRSAEN